MKNYSYEEIFRMLLPKLKKHYPDIEHRIVNDCVDWAFLLSLCYKSGYMRGQLGRSFIIDEPKQTEHWVPATRDNVKVGSKVRMIDEKAHASSPDCYPSVGTVGVVIDNNICRILPLIQWPRDSVGNDDVTHCISRYLEVLVCE